MLGNKRAIEGISSPKPRRPEINDSRGLPIISPKKLKTQDASSTIFIQDDDTPFNDPVHGCVKIGGLCKRVIDTPQFQRLDKLKQLGVSHTVFRGATHSRFIHSIGVAHLAEKMVSHLRLPGNSIIPIDEKDALCVKLAGNIPFESPITESPNQISTPH